MKDDILRIFALISLDFKSEYRNKYDSFGLLLFVVVLSYILYRSTEAIDPFSFNSLLWVFVLVLSINFALRAFTKTKEEESNFLYHIVSSQQVLIAKLIFNWLLIFIGGLVFLLTSLLFHSSVDGFNSWPIGDFILLMLIGTLCISSTFSLPSALVMSSNNKGSLLGILSFPISIPIVLVCASIGGELITQQTWNMNGLVLLLSVILIMSTVSLYLFKFNWQS